MAISASSSYLLDSEFAATTEADGLHLAFQSRQSLHAEVLFLRRQLALYVARGVKPRRIAAATRVSSRRFLDDFGSVRSKAVPGVGCITSAPCALGERDLISAEHSAQPKGLALLRLRYHQPEHQYDGCKRRHAQPEPHAGVGSIALAHRSRRVML